MPRTTPLPPGRIDIHSHMLPGIDDGCREVHECLESIRQLKAFGFVGSFCTPHVWPELFPLNTADNIRAWTKQLQRQLQEAGEDYQLWPGGEIRIHENVMDWLHENGFPTLGDSRCLLMDFWADQWPDWAYRVLEQMIREGYQPILAHPERLGCVEELPACAKRLNDMGVWLQGNSRCMTGEETYTADKLVRQLLKSGHFQFMALDMHRTDSLESRIDGLKLVEQEFGKAKLDELTITGPRKLVLGEGA